MGVRHQTLPLPDHPPHEVVQATARKLARDTSAAVGSLLLASEVRIPDMPLHAATVRAFVPVGVRGVAIVDSSAKCLVQRARGSDISELTYATGRRCCRTAKLQNMSPVNVTSSSNFRSADRRQD